MNARVEKLMKTLNISEAEALELIEEDKEIDRGAKLYELPDELKAAAKKARRAERKKPEKVNRERKVDENKKVILEACATACSALGLKVVSQQTETEIELASDNATYTLKLIKHRPKSN